MAHERHAQGLIRAARCRLEACSRTLAGDDPWPYFGDVPGLDSAHRCFSEIEHLLPAAYVGSPGRVDHLPFSRADRVLVGPVAFDARQVGDHVVVREIPVRETELLVDLLEHVDRRPAQALVSDLI